MLIPPTNETPFGITVAVCCHNSSKRLPQTLKHLSEQTLPASEWELLVIDNASTDDTSQTTKNLWPADSEIRLRVISEPRLGLSYARERAIKESRFPIINFVDDDNWLAPDWLATADKIMRQNPRIGACGGQITAAFETAPPSWFEKYKWMYAVSKESDETGDVTDGRGFVIGAGLILRKDAWHDLISLGFSNLLVGRRGRALTSGEDSEICAALRLAGWRLWSDPDLKMKHYIENHRLSWAYLCQLSHGFGRSWVIIDLYYAGLGVKFHSLSGIRSTRIWKIGGGVKRLFRHPTAILKLAIGRGEGDRDILEIYSCCGRLAGLAQWTKEEQTFWQFLEACKSRNQPTSQDPSSCIRTTQRA